MNYYNENNPFAAAWIRELINDGHIADGIVDERSIVEVKPEELAPFAQCHFFAGIAGWPDDQPVWTGSCPCQPLSCAGQGKGHADERHLWPAFYHLIAERQPTTVFGEQVASALGREWLAGIRADLEGIRYAVGASDLCAAGVKAKHIRQRFWWVANTIGNNINFKPCCGQAGRMGRIIKPVSWDRDWQSALREFRALDDGLSYGVEACNGPRNAIVPQLAAEFIQAAVEAIAEQ